MTRIRAFFANTLGGLPSFTAVKSFDLDGTDEYLSYGDDAAIDFDYTDTFSISVWVKVDATGSFEGVCGKVTGTNKGYSIYKTAADEFEFAIQSGGSYLLSVFFEKAAAGWSLGDWINVVGTYDGSNTLAGMNIYFNADDTDRIDDQDFPFSASMLSGQPFNIGKQGFLSNYLDGKITQVSLWDKELSGTEVSDIYNSGSPDDLNEHSASANLVLWMNPDTCVWDGSADYDCPDDSGTLSDGVSVNVEEADLITDAP